MDQAYLSLLREILEHGARKADRTGTGTLSVFGRLLRHDLRDGFPLLTTKRLHVKSIVYELLWFLGGGTNVRFLNEHGVSIWDEWATPDGELGPVYGAQWRAWRTPSGDTVDQVAALIERIRSKPDSRRHIISAWNVADLPDEARSPQLNVAAGKMALAPCHVIYQFYVLDGSLSCMLTQRSCDVFLGLPYNAASTALLTCMVAQQCDLEPGEVIYALGDAHLYSNHLEQARLQIARVPRALPRLLLKRRPESILDYRFDDFEIVGYEPHAHIAAPIAK
ncbi:MAG TPA: thymidylate synthase [Steroidobacteraceae bacterium]|jgi:thymidylate synthase|nr:thymidylate synthase [Steroidobacteraceae bacterium]